ncbi:hypothetical protein [Pseudobacteriovorax antillogorgiicola]|uniref:Lipoprotein n=1 Tax=Pseudobacteriovorax antillogorgiicola TaxID=1513793 RepID=A0A1Y6CYH6_9BACT|nr:hypothetical protein [Pseudobacteriovorax antillogorgiicola]TCS41894.1 hypothetical protein EDD56_1458 [Pseudobacteriovorax antillogorgiicola]SMF83170.1 hypothetical protein SAMN06296036_1454 [Pseudobacteriovorax antillogorgiicola]
MKESQIYLVVAMNHTKIIICWAILSACGSDQSSSDSKPLDSGVEPDTAALEPIPVGGTFLVDCEPIEHGEQTLILGCRATDPAQDLSLIKTKAYIIEDGLATLLESLPRASSWQNHYSIPTKSIPEAVFRLDIINDSGDATGSFMEPLVSLTQGSAVQR